MTYGMAGVVVGLCGIGAGVAAGLVRRRVRIDALQRHHEIGSAVFLQMGVVFAVLLAFVFNEVWGEYNAAAEAIARESGDLRVAALMAGNLPRADAESIRALIMAYLSTVIQDEWPAMENQQESGFAEMRLQQLALGVEQLPIPNARESSTRQQIANLLQSAEQYRRSRIYQMGQGMPGMLWFMLIAFSLLLVGFLFFFGIENIWSQVLFTGVFAASLALVLVILVMLDLPFQGAMRLSAAPFQHTLDHLRQAM